MRQLLALIFLTAGAAMAGDVTGTWTGALVRTDNNGSQDNEAYVVLKQEGNTVTGTGGPNAGEQHPISKGAVDGEKLTFQIDVGEGGVIKFTLTAKGDIIEGDVVQEREAGIRTGKLTLKRSKT